jgi:hypothetical protein
MRSPPGILVCVRRLALLSSICVLAASCARSTAATGASTSPASTQIGPPLKYGGVLTMTPADSGKTVVLGAGDTLIFMVPTPPPNRLAWRIVSYPRNLISLLSGSARPPFRFRALHAGTGDLRLGSGPPCGGPGPLAAGDQQCPVVGDSELGPPGFANRLLVFHLKVQPRG